MPRPPEPPLLRRPGRPVVRAPHLDAVPAVAIGSVSTAEVGDALLALEISHDVEGLARAHVLLDDHRRGAGWLSRDELDFGAPVQVRGGGEDLFEGRVTALASEVDEDVPPRVEVTALDPLEALAGTVSSRVWHDLTDVAVIQSIADEHGIAVEATLDDPGVEHSVVSQIATDDLSFVRQRAALLDADLFVTGGQLHVRARAARGPVVAELELGSGLHAFDARADLEGQPTSVRVGGWAPTVADVVDVVVGADVIDAETAGHPGGPRRRSRAFGDRPAVLPALVRSGDEARLRGRSELRTRARRFVTALAVCDFRAPLRPGVRVGIDVGGGPFDGEYGVVAVTHRFDREEGTTTMLVLERPWFGDRA